MRIFAFILSVAVVLLQYRVWFSDHGDREVSRLAAEVETQAAANLEQRDRNRQLAAEVNDLKVGLSALEERARSELGMVGNSETFYQVVTAESPVPETASRVTASGVIAGRVTAGRVAAGPVTAGRGTTLSR